MSTVEEEEEDNKESEEEYPYNNNNRDNNNNNRKPHKKNKSNYSSSSSSRGKKFGKRRRRRKPIEEEDENSSQDFWSKHEYAQMYNILKDFEKFGADICVPEFVFFGLQSAGKTSAVSQAARLPVGVMKNGTGSRCPTRFKLKYNADEKTPLIRVNGEVMNDEQEMIDTAIEHMKNLERKNKFSTNVLEIRIDWKHAPELTFVDLPGMITNPDQKYSADRRQLENITGHYLNQRKHGRYQYMPVLVKEAVEEENDTGRVEDIVDRVIKKYRDPNGCTIKRYDWKNHTLFIVNKFDKLLNVGSAKELMRSMKVFNKENNGARTVITMLNPNEEMTGKMDYSDLKQFVRRVPNAEKIKWQSVFTNFSVDEHTPALKKLCLKMCGVGKMNEIVVNKMVQIVQRILPDIKQVLDQTEQQKQKELESIRRQIANCDPIRLKTAVTKFNQRFMNYMKNFYTGVLFMKLQEKMPEQLKSGRRLTWAEELSQFHQFADIFFDNYSGIRPLSHENVHGWRNKGYERSANVLLELLARAHRRRRLFFDNSSSNNNANKDTLSLDIEMRLIGSPSLKRILDVWSAMVAFMPFPKFTDDDIHNAKHLFNETKQASMWSSIRTIVLESVEHFVQACYWLAEMARFRMKRNADMMFEYTIIEEFGTCNNERSSSSSSSSSSFAYQGITDVMRQKNEMEGRGRGRGKLKNNNSSSGTLIDANMRQLLNRGLISYKKVIDQIIDGFLETSQVVPADHAQILDKMFCEQNINLGYYINKVLREKHQYLAIKNTAITNEARAVAEALDDDNDNDDNNVIIDTRNMNHQNVVSMYNNNNYESDSKLESGGEDPYRADLSYYRNIHGQGVKHMIVVNDMQFNVETVRVLAHAAWIGIKYVYTRDIHQKFGHQIMSVVKQQKLKNDSIANAVQCGIERKELEKCMEQLMKITHIKREQIEALVKNPPIDIPKDIAQMEPEELSKIYGVDRGELIKKQESKVKELNEFVQLKRETLLKITQIKQQN